MNVFIAAILFVSLSAHAGWLEKVQAKLPEKVRQIKPGKTDRTEARKFLGKPDLVHGDKEYWIFDGFKYALELTYTKNKVSSVHFNFPQKNFSMESLSKDVNPKLIRTSPSAPHTSLIYEDKEGKMEIELTSGLIESVRFQ